MTVAATSTTTERVRQPPGQRRQVLTRRRREAIAGYLFVAPDALGLLVFVLVPMVISFVLGFFSASGFGDYSFVGFDNYRRMFSDPLFVKTGTITLVYVVLFVPLLFSVSLGLALLVRVQRRWIGFIRSLFFAPNVVSLVVVALVWQLILVDRIGVLNRISSAVGLGSASWLGSPKLAFVSVLLVSVWFFMGYYMTIFVAGLQDIPNDYYDAARVDGAGRWRLFRDVTWPLLRPTSLFVAMIITISGVGGLQAFDLIYVMTKGGPDNGTSLVIFYIYQQAFQDNDLGYAAAMASFVVFVLLLAMLAMFRLTKGGRFDN